MPQQYKTCINNLLIVWQGSRWCVIAPNGEVLARFMDKYMAEAFAGADIQYASPQYKPYGGSSGNCRFDGDDEEVRFLRGSSR